MVLVVTAAILRHVPAAGNVLARLAVYVSNLKIKICKQHLNLTIHRNKCRPCSLTRIVCTMLRKTALAYDASSRRSIWMIRNSGSPNWQYPGEEKLGLIAASMQEILGNSRPKRSLIICRSSLCVDNWRLPFVLTILWWKEWTSCFSECVVQSLLDQIIRWLPN